MNISITVYLLLGSFLVTSDRNPTQTGLNTKRESIGSENFTERLATKQDPKVNLLGTNVFRALLTSPGLRSPCGSASHGGKTVVEALSPAPVPRPGRASVRRPTAEHGLGSYLWELPSGRDMGEPCCEFGRVSFLNRRAHEPS